ncbi:MAG: DNA polymerase III subunit delta' [Candidatus Omnitrophota bacterium]
MSFKDIKGQERAIQIIKSNIEHNRLKGGYLFTGQEGIGKKMAAKNLAKAINCEKARPDSCDVCPSCIKIEKNQHIDVHVIEGEDSEIKIDNIRQLKKDANFRPYEARYKVFIIDNAHNLNAEAANALLKTLEEPPGHTLIILITDKPRRLFKTIISRCTVVKFLPLVREELEELLRRDFGLMGEPAHFLAYFSEGRPGAAFRLKDTDIFTQKNMIIDKLVLSDRFSSGDYSPEEKTQLKMGLNILSTWFRDVYMLKTGIAHSEIINADRKQGLLKSATHYSFMQLNRILNTISDSILYAEQNINTKLILHNLRAQLWKT